MKPSQNSLFKADTYIRSIAESGILGLVHILDADKRAEAAKKLYQRLREESYELSVGYTNIPWGVGPRVLTWEPYPLAPFITAIHTITLK
jgi:hypothetical protein